MSGTSIFSLFDSVADFEVESILIFITSLFKPVRLVELKLLDFFEVGICGVRMRTFQLV